ncbi:hypothetical protein DFH09DRAFT_1339455 [Mycena vulgaris]|nr:hypothetical protein DFH09DRAFT_1339455 [Mycena vulgaris]
MNMSATYMDLMVEELAVRHPPRLCQHIDINLECPQDIARRRNTAPSSVWRRGRARLVSDKHAVIDLGGAKGIMMAYNELDEDLGLFEKAYIPDSVDSAALMAAHNRDNTLPIKPDEQGIKTIALIGPFSDILNYGDYSGPWGAYPIGNSSTICQAIRAHLAATAPGVSLVSMICSKQGAPTAFLPLVYATDAIVLPSVCLVTIALNAKIRTVEWTPALFQDQILQNAMKAVPVGLAPEWLQPAGDGFTDKLARVWHNTRFTVQANWYAVPPSWLQRRGIIDEIAEVWDGIIG